MHRHATRIPTPPARIPWLAPGLLFGLFAAAAVCSLASACAPDCSLEAELKDKAAAGAIDCGEVRLRADRAATDACVVESFRANRPFYAQYQTQGIDSETITGFVGGADGSITLYHYGGAMGGGGGAGETITLLLCDAPMLKTDVENRGEGTIPIDCAKVSSQGRVCG